MQTSFSEVIFLTILITTILLVLFGCIVIFFVFHNQKKRYHHQWEILELQEVFNKTLLQSKLEIQEQTLDHIAKELHANIGHLASLININLSASMPQEPGEIRDNVIETKSLARQLMSELKALSASLNTDHIMHIGIIKALKNELNRLARIKKYEISFTQSGEEYRLSPEHQIILFRLCQEVFNNIVKYAHATKVTASVNYLPADFELEITDNGIGFDVELALNQSAEKASTGLLNIKKRAKLIHAETFFVSKPNAGTTVKLIIPRKNII